MPSCKSDSCRRYICTYVFVGAQGRGVGGVSSAWWKKRTGLKFALRLVVGGDYVWYLVVVAILMGFVQVGAKRCGGALKSSTGLAMHATRGELFL